MGTRFCMCAQQLPDGLAASASFVEEQGPKMRSFGEPIVDDINAKMAKYAPELASEYATYPMYRSRWLPVTGKTPCGEACFIESATNKGMKKNYVFGPGPKGFGYYHLLTRASYLSLYARLTHEAPQGFCCFMSKAARDDYAAYEEVKRLVFYRSRSSQPIDFKPRQNAVTDDTCHVEKLNE